MSVPTGAVGQGSTFGQESAVAQGNTDVAEDLLPSQVAETEVSGAGYDGPEGPAEEGPPTEGPAEEPDTPPGPGWFLDERITRFLCATAHLDASYADHVVEQLLDPKRQAIAPAWEIDPVAVAAHAKLSQSRRIGRDLALQLVLLRNQTAQVLTAFAGFRNDIEVEWVPRLLIIWPVLGWGIAWLIVFAHYLAVRDSALAANNANFPPRDSAPDLDFEDEARLGEAHRSNAVLFGGYLPFASSGHTIDTWRLVFDLDWQRRNPGKDSKARQEFTALDVHDYLLEHVPPLLDDVHATRRVYIDGGTAPGVDQRKPPPVDRLIPAVPRIDAPPQRPASVLREESLDEFTTNPTRTARTYCCFVKSALNGDVVVTVLVRVEISGSTMFVEGRSHALLPVQSPFKDVVWVSAKAGALPTARAATATTTGLLLESLFRGIAARRGARAEAQRLRDEAETITLGLPVPYGATISSLREEASVTTDSMYFAAVEEIMYFKSMSRVVLMAIGDFLAEHDVLAPDFEEQRNLIALRTHNISGFVTSTVVGSDNSAAGSPNG